MSEKASKRGRPKKIDEDKPSRRKPLKTAPGNFEIEVSTREAEEPPPTPQQQPPEQPRQSQLDLSSLYGTQIIRSSDIAVAFQTVKIRNLRHTINVLKDFFIQTIFFFEPNGIFVRGKTTSMKSFLMCSIYAPQLDYYKCEYASFPKAILLKTIQTAIKPLSTNSVFTFYITNKELKKYHIITNHTNSKGYAYYQYDESDMRATDVQIKNSSYSADMDFDHSELNLIVNGMVSSGAKTVEIIVSEKGVKMLCSGDQLKKYEKFLEASDKDGGLKRFHLSDKAEIIQGVFSLAEISKFTKKIKQSATTNIKMANNMPLFISHEIGDFSTIQMLIPCTKEQRDIVDIVAKKKLLSPSLAKGHIAEVDDSELVEDI